MNICFELEKIKVTPYSILCVMNDVVRRFAYCAFKSTAWRKIDMQIQPLFFIAEFYGFDIPGILKIQCKFK